MADLSVVPGQDTFIGCDSLVRCHLLALQV